MLDHFGLYCRDAGVSLPFYRACLEAIEIRVVEEQPRFKSAIFKHEASPIFWWLGEGDPHWRDKAGISRMHIGFRAHNAAQVDAFYAVAIAAGRQAIVDPPAIPPSSSIPTVIMSRRSGRPSGSRTAPRRP